MFWTRPKGPLDPAVGPQTVVQNVQRDPLGTFSVGPNQPLLMTYDPPWLNGRW